MKKIPDIKKKALEALCKNYSSDIEFDVDLSAKNSIHIGGTGFAWYVPGSIKELVAVITFARDNIIPWRIIGNGSNVLFSDGRSEYLYISLKSHIFKRIRVKGDLIFAGAGISINNVIKRSLDKGLSGFESLVGIPGTIGGAIKMNASYKNCISDFFVKALMVDQEGCLSWVKKEDLCFTYRNALTVSNMVIIKAVFKMIQSDPHIIKEELRRNFMEKMTKQPLACRTLGCVFKNPGNLSMGSGQIIEKTGLKGLSSGDALVSEKHANFIVNSGKATAEDVKILIKKTKEEVKNQFGISLETEIEIM